MRWRLYYDDGSTFDSEQGAAADAPKLGVLVIAQFDADCGRLLWHGRDYYVLIDGQWLGVDMFGLIDQVLHKLHQTEAVVAGRSVPNAVFDQVMQQAHDDPDFPVKSGWKTIESPRDQARLKV